MHLLNETTTYDDFDEQLAANMLTPGLSSLYSPEEDSLERVRDIADVLLEEGVLDNGQIEAIRQDQRRSNDDICEYILKESLASQNEILKAKARLYGFDFLELVPDEIDASAFNLLSVDYIKSVSIAPIGFDEEKLIVATSVPENILAIDDVHRQTSRDLKIVVCMQDDILGVCDYMTQQSFDIDLDDIVSDMTEVEVVQDEQEDSDDLEKMAGQSPVIKYVNYLISNAIHEGASDIHIEPKEKIARIRYRIDGALFETMQIPSKMHPAVVSRLKIMSNLDISERRLPQDGKVAAKVGGRNIDLRVSILPTSHGEKVVIRVLDSKSIMRGLESSGMSGNMLDNFKKQIALPNGIFLVTGPTGSGKSTTLYSALGQMDGDTLNVSTVEDPVEYNLSFCNQVQVNEKIGMTFSAALRSLLRQDPDIIMLGEIRDGETAQIAVRAALTGHLVLSTLHTNDASSSITRLVNIGIDPYLIAAALNGVLAQRLVRKICDNCKEEYQPPENIQRQLGEFGYDGQMWHGCGCDKCRDSGYAGRAGVFEMLTVDDSFREVINKDPSIDNMRRAFVEQGNKTLFEDGLEKVRNGITTIDEILRVTQA